MMFYSSGNTVSKMIFAQTGNKKQKSSPFLDSECGACLFATCSIIRNLSGPNSNSEFPILYKICLQKNIFS